MKIVKHEVELVALLLDPNDRDVTPEQIIEKCGRTCYKSEDKITVNSAAAFVIQMRNRGHHAMIEFGDAIFNVITDRGITHEIVRHRLASYAQESTRYCNYSGEKFGKSITVIEPPGLSAKERNIWYHQCLSAEAAYFAMLKNCSPQIARSVLPTCTKTEIKIKMNFREIRHFIGLRAAQAAHPQIRPVAKLMCNIMFDKAPNVFRDLYEEYGN